jgi:hypothetical protein
MTVVQTNGNVVNNNVVASGNNREENWSLTLSSVSRNCRFN